MCNLLLKKCCFVFVRIFYRVRIFGLENIPKNEAVIFESNYSSAMDHLFIALACKRNVCCVIPKQNRSFLFSFIFKILKCIEEPQEKTLQTHAEFIKKIKKALAQKRALCFFPENQVTKNGLIGKFHDKLADIAWEYSQVKIVPVYIGPPLRGKNGYEKNIRKKGFINVCFGNTMSIDTEPYKVRNAVMELSAEVEYLPRHNEKTLHYAFLNNAKAKLWKKLFHEAEGKTLSMFEILLKSLLLSRIIKQKQKQSRYIGVLLPNSNAAAISILSVMYADLVPAILNFSMAPLVFKRALEKSGIDVILTSRLFIEKIKFEKMAEMVFLEDIAKEINPVDKLFFVLAILFLPSVVLIRLFSKASYANLRNAAVLLFSSGSSGTPKGVILSHHNVNSNVNSFINIMGMQAGMDKISGCLPLFHSFGMNICFWVPLMYGVSVVFIKNPLEIDEVIKSIRDYKLTLLATTPTILNAYIKKSERSDFKTLRLLILGGEKFNSKDAKGIRNLTGIEPIEGFGCTELSPVVSINIADDFKDFSTMSGKVGSIGKALPGIAAKIVNQDTWKDVLPDRKGLLLIKSPSVMEGYLSEEATKNAIIDGWYNTGDIASIDEEGYITIVGRVSRFSKIAGEMVSHELIEALIYEYLNIGDRLLAVMGVKDAMKGERLLVLYSGLKLNPHKIIGFLLKKGLSNLWIPKIKDFIKIDEIPLLGTGKMDIAKLNEVALRFSS